MGYSIDIDTGGTFTDGFFVFGNHVETVKVPTTPHDLTICFMECIKAGAASFQISVEDLLFQTDIIRFSNTIGTNTIIQRDGSKVGLLVTAGREGLTPDKSSDGKSPLVLPDMVLGLSEAVSRSGEVVAAPDERTALAAAQELIDRGARALVIAFSGAEFNPANERLVRKTVKREYPGDYLGSVPVFLSSDVSRRSGDRERINAAVLNAYIHDKLVRLLYNAGEKIRQRFYHRNLFIVHSNGSVARVAKTRAINTYNSGPAAGLLGARLTGRCYGADDLISADMGGTSFDIGYVRGGQVSYSLNPDVEGFPVNIPMLAVRAIGAGGGSIAFVQDGKLQVGPQSAGALPGPACFDLGGTEPTVTDANLILGILDPSFFLGGSMRLNKDKAVEAMERGIGRPLGLPVEQAALMVKKTIDEAMGREIKRLKDEIWADQQDPLLVVYGGAGPAHCCGIAGIAGLRRIVITPFSAVFSAFSSSGMDVGHVYYRRLDIPFDDLGEKTLSEPVAGMRREAMRDMRGEGFDASTVHLNLELFLTPQGGGAEVKVEADPDFFRDQRKVKAVQEKAYDLLRTAEPNQREELLLTMVGLTAQAPVPHYSLEASPAAVGRADEARKGSRTVFLDPHQGGLEAPVYERAKLQHGHRIEGPALVDSPQTTMLVPPGWRLTVDRFNNALLEEDA